MRRGYDYGRDGARMQEFIQMLKRTREEFQLRRGEPRTVSTSANGGETCNVTGDDPRHQSTAGVGAPAQVWVGSSIGQSLKGATLRASKELDGGSAAVAGSSDAERPKAADAGSSPALSTKAPAPPSAEGKEGANLDQSSRGGGTAPAAELEQPRAWLRVHENGRQVNSFWREMPK